MADVIAEIRADKGLIGIAPAPRALPADLDRIAAWNPTAVVTLVEEDELARLGLARIGEDLRGRHIAWHHWPIRDYDIPDGAFTAAWPARSAMLRAILAGGGRVLIHCRGGLGRSGTIAAQLLADTGAAPEAAIAAIRAVRPGAIETAEQARWIRRAAS